MVETLELNTQRRSEVTGDNGVNETHGFSNELQRAETQLQFDQ